MIYNPNEDGITHLNAYSNAKTELGQFLSNFAYCPINTLDGEFDSIEGYWGWLSISENNRNRESLRYLYGIDAKKYKESLLINGDPGRIDDRFAEKIAYAIHQKFKSKDAFDLLGRNRALLELPLVHYYVTENGIVDVTEKYPEFINSLRKEISGYLKNTTVFTSYYEKAKYLSPNKYAFVQISNSVPKDWTMPITKLKKAIPDWEIVSSFRDGRISESDYDKAYTEALKIYGIENISNEIQAIANDTGKIPVLLCYEKEEQFCHRHLLSRELGYSRELTNDDISRIEQPDGLFGVSKGIICQQVNCKGVMGAGLAKAIADKFPIVYEKYKQCFEKMSPEELFGKTALVKITPDLYVANIFSQFNYGTHEVQTDVDKLVSAVSKLCDKMPEMEVYLPCSRKKDGNMTGIGCGLGGARWVEVEPMFKALNKPNLHLLDTFNETVHELNSEAFGQSIVNSTLYEGKTIVYDTETTGISNSDEIIQIAITTEQGEPILDTFVKPVAKKSWVEAEAVNHISPDMVKDAPTMAQLKPVLAEVFGKCSLVVGHNVTFDNRMVKNTSGIEISKDKCFDTCTHFKKAEPSLSHKLESAVNHYAPGYMEYYKEGAHGALTDTVATAAVYRGIKGIESLYPDPDGGIER